MIYLVTLIVWLNTGDSVAMSKTFPSQEVCDTARQNALQGLAAKEADFERQGIVSYIVTPCMPYSNPDTETKS